MTFLILAFSNSRGQNNMQHVINSAGMHHVASNGTSLTDNVGEPFVSTLNGSNFLVTQGFLQPFTLIGGFKVVVSKQDISCKDKTSEAFLAADIQAPANVAAYKATYNWSTPGRCSNCSRIDTLNAGTYSVYITINYTTTTGAVKRDSLSSSNVQIYASDEPCKINIYKGVTPNNDGLNDTWYIGNIEEYPNNHVTVYSRWGNKVFEVDGYNNKDKSFPHPGTETNYQSSTYFYVIDLGGGTKPYKGWLEVIKSN